MQAGRVVGAEQVVVKREWRPLAGPRSIQAGRSDLLSAAVALHGGDCWAGQVGACEP